MLKPSVKNALRLAILSEETEEVSEGARLKSMAEEIEELMKVRRLITLTVTVIFLSLLAIPNVRAQELKSFSADARGQGTLTVGKEVFKVGTVVVRLKEGGTGELTLVTDLAIFLTCDWSAPSDLSQGIDLKITGGTNPGSAEGSGKLFLRADGKSVASLAMQGNSTSVKRKIQIKFVAD